jgi:hypothetical protein
MVAANVLSTSPVYIQPMMCLQLCAAVSIVIVLVKFIGSEDHNCGDSLNNVRCETSRTFTYQKVEYVKEKN